MCHVWRPIPSQPPGSPPGLENCQRKAGHPGDHWFPKDWRWRAYRFGRNLWRRLLCLVGLHQLQEYQNIEVCPWCMKERW